jgi:hypothetical protein
MQVGDSIPRSQLAGVLADGDHFAGELVPEDDRKLQPRKASTAVDEIAPTDASRTDANENLVVTRRRLRHLPEDECFGSPGSIDDDGVHHAAPLLLRFVGRFVGAA